MTTMLLFLRVGRCVCVWGDVCVCVCVGGGACVRVCVCVCVCGVLIFFCKRPRIWWDGTTYITHYYIIMFLNPKLGCSFTCKLTPLNFPLRNSWPVPSPDKARMLGMRPVNVPCQTLSTDTDPWEQRPGSLMVTVTWHGSEYQVPKLHLGRPTVVGIWLSSCEFMVRRSPVQFLSGAAEECFSPELTYVLLF